MAEERMGLDVRCMHVGSWCCILRCTCTSQATEEQARASVHDARARQLQQQAEHFQQQADRLQVRPRAAAGRSTRACDR